MEKEKLHGIEIVVLVSALNEMSCLYGGATLPICTYLANRYVDRHGEPFEVTDIEEAMICYALLSYGTYHRDKFNELAIFAISLKLGLSDKVIELGRELVAMMSLEKQNACGLPGATRLN